MPLTLLICVYLFSIQPVSLNVVILSAFPELNTLFLCLTYVSIGMFSRICPFEEKFSFSWIICIFSQRWSLCYAFIFLKVVPYCYILFRNYVIETLWVYAWWIALKLIYWNISVCLIMFYFIFLCFCFGVSVGYFFIVS